MLQRICWRLATAALVLATANFAFAQPVSQGRLLAPDAVAGNGFGRGLDVDGDVAVIAARTGVLPYVWERIAGVWQPVARLDPGEDIGTVAYGYAVAVSGQRIAVGAPESPSAGPRRSSVHVFEKVDGSWVHAAKLTVTEAQTDDFFGGAVDLSGDRLLVGAEGAHLGMAQVQGVAYVFAKGPSGWVLEEKLYGTDSTTYDNFGKSVAIDGDRIVIGCIGADHGQGGSFDGGAAYVFERSGNDWLQSAKLAAPVPASNEQFGRSVAVSGDTIAAGVPGARVGSMNWRGAVDVFERVAGVWQHRTRVVASDGRENEYFGQTGLALTPSRLYVGSPQHQIDDQWLGSVYAYRRDGGGQWLQSSRFEAYDGVPGQSFGGWIGASSNHVLVGAQGHDQSRGAVYVLFDGLLFKDGFEAPAAP
ncbi:MAG: FG-GAP repeat protein [Xanthomonadales bacterium]|nr:FG-GAP repeat protein [Xanthomonadales bacterium]